MQITFICPACHAEWAADASAAGSSVECPTCKQTITVPKKGHGPGVILGGFKILKLLGKGGMGEVYLAQQMSMGRNVALKILPGSLSMEKSMVERFFKEVRLLAQLDHPNIVTAYEAGEDTDILYLAMAYVDGDPMEKRLKDKGPLKEKEALQIVYKLAGALDYAWSKFQILHRDIKPGNILQTAEDEVKLADLGLAKSLTESVETTMSGTILGTPNYMSPEQINAQADLDCRTDIYSMGATLYHLLTGRIPFGGSTLMETLRKQLDDNLPDPREYQPELSEACVRLMEIMMAKDREQRHADWKAVKADVERVLHGEEPLKEPLPPGSSVLIRSDAIANKPVVAGKRASEPHLNTKLIAVAAGVLLVAAGAAVLYRALRLSPGIETKPQTATETVQKTEALPISSNTPDTEKTVEAKPDQAGALAKLSRQYAKAVTFTRDHPEEYTGALAMFEMLSKEAEGTEYAANIAEEIQRLTIGRKKAVEKYLVKLKEKVNADVEAGKYEEALSRLEDETGPMAKDSEAVRAEIAKEVRQKQKSVEETTSQQQAEEQRNKQAEEARSKLAESLESIVTNLMKGDYPSAAQTASALKTNEVFSIVSNEVETLNELVGEVVTLPEVVLKSLEQDKQKNEVAIEFRTGQTERLQVLAVGEKTFKVKRQVGAGSMERDYSISDLSFKEKLKRLGDDPRPQRAIMRGLLASQSGDQALAEKEFASAGGMLGYALGEAVQKRTSAKTKVAVQQKQTKADDKKKEDLTIEQTLSSKSKPSAGSKSVPMKEATNKNVEEALAKLVKDNPGLEDIAKSYSFRDNGIILQLSDNPKLNDISALTGLPLLELNLQHTDVQDLRPLKGMPLQYLNINSTPVTELGPLAGLPLTRLNMNFTKMTDLKPLIGIPLYSLSLFDAQVADLSPLKDMPSLRCLNLIDSTVTDFSPIKRLRLTELLVGNKNEKISLRCLDGMPLVKLYFDHADNIIDIEKMPDYFPEVQELRLFEFSSNPEFILRFQKLQKVQLVKDDPCMPLDQFKEYLKKTFASSATPSISSGVKLAAGSKALPMKNASNKNVDEALDNLVKDNPGLGDVSKSYTIQSDGVVMDFTKNSNLKDISALAGLPLVKLNLYMTNVKDLGPLRGMPLKFLDVGLTRVMELTPLAGMQIERLEIVYTGVNDLTPIKGMPMKYLNLTSTKVNDLKPLIGMPLDDLELFTARSVSDISPLKDMNSLRRLSLSGTMVADFSPIKHIKLSYLQIGNEKEKISLKPLDGMPITILHIYNTDNVIDIDKTPDYFPDVKELRLFDLPSNPGFILRFNNVRMIQLGKDAQYEDADKVKEYIKKSFPSSETKPSAGLKSQPASTTSTMLGKKPDKGAAQAPKKEATNKNVDEALDNLAKDNPGLENITKSYSFRNNGIILNLNDNPKLKDISALAGLPLVELNLDMTSVKDLSPLQGMPLKGLNFGATRVIDLAPLSGMQIEKLEFNGTEVSDLAPLKGMPLQSLALNFTKVKDLKTLIGMPLSNLNLYNTMVTDFSPIKHLRLTCLQISNEKERISLKPLDGMPVTHLKIKFADNVIDIDKTPDYFPDVEELSILGLSSNPGFILQFQKLNKIQLAENAPFMTMDQFKDYLKKTFPSSGTRSANK